MKKQIILTLTILLIFTGLNFSKLRKVDTLKYPALKKFNIPVVLKTKTKNGIKIRLIKTDKLPLVNVVLIIKGGSVYDPTTKVSLADMTARMLRIGGTVKMNGEKVDAYLDSNGISIFIRSDLEMFVVNMSCLDEKLDKGLEILSKLLKTPGFDKKKLEEIKTQFYSTVQRRNDNPQPILSNEFNKVIYGENTPFSAVLEYEHIDNITMQDIKKEYKKFFAPDNILMGVSGQVKLNEVKKIIEKHFGNWNNKADIPAYPSVTAPKHDYKVAFASKESLNQNYITIGHIGFKQDEKLEATIKVFNSIFSQGMDSRLFNKVRTELGLTYGISGGIISNEWHKGKVAFSTFTKSESTIPVIKAIFGEINKIRKGKVTKKELSNAKNYFMNSYVFKFSTPEKVLYTKLSEEFYGEDENAQVKLMENIKKVTADDVYKLVQKYLHPEQMTVVVVGNKKLIKGNLSEIGKVKTLDISIKPPAIKEVIPEATPESLKRGKKIIKNLFKKKYKGYKKLKSLKTSFTMSMKARGMQMAIDMNLRMVYPNKSYTEISVMGMKFTEIVDGKKGVRNQMGKKIQITAKEIKSRQFGREYDMYHNMKDYKFQYLKDVKIKGAIYSVVYITKSDNKKWKKLFINKKTGYIEITESMSSQPNAVGVTRTVSSDFRIISGIPFDFKSEVYLKGKIIRSMIVKSIEINPKIDKKIFTIK